MTGRVALIALIIASISSTAGGDDWPQFRGPHRDGRSAETGLLTSWPTGGPKLLWTYDRAGLGYSGPAIVGDRIYLCGGRDDGEYLFALDSKKLSTPQDPEAWSARIGPLFQWKGNNWNKGPNASPTVGGGNVYALGGLGDLVCFSTKGQEIWRRNLPRDLGGEVNPIGGGLAEPTPLGWGYAAAPLLDGDQLICVPGGPGGLLAALDPASGAVKWRSSGVTDQASYSSPLVVRCAGIKQYIQAVNSGLVGISAADGKRLWTYSRQPAYDDVVIATPLFHDGYVYSTVGFGQGCDLIKLTPRDGGTQVTPVFSSKSVENRDGGVVLIDGHVYGHSENKGWFCQELATGKVVWSERRKLARGSITYADGRLYCCAENGGEIALIEPTTKGWTEHGRFKLPRESNRRQPSGGLWTHPVISGGRLFIRDQELLFCFEVKAS